jgi:hypothetical protein
LKKLTSKLRKKLPWDDWELEKNPKLLDKTAFKLTKRYVGYVTDNPEEFRQLQNEYRNVVYSNRISIPKMEPVKGTQQLHDVASCKGERDSSNMKLRKLRISAKPCSCLKCRKGNGVCEFTEYRKEKVIWVQEDCDDPENMTKQTRRTTIKLTQEVEKQLREKIGVEKVTTESLRTYLKAKGQRTSGVKAELVARVLELR